MILELAKKSLYSIYSIYSIGMRTGCGSPCRALFTKIKNKKPIKELFLFHSYSYFIPNSDSFRNYFDSKKSIPGFPPTFENLEAI